MLLVALCAGGTALVWTSSPDLVRKLDRWITSKYEGGPRRALEEARKEESPEGIHRLEELLEDLDGIRKGDVLYPVKREALELLTGRLEARGDFANATRWVSVWVGLDERDLDAHLSRARLLYRDPETRVEAIGQLSVLQHRFPEVEEITSTYVGMLIGEDRQEEACQVLLDYLSSSLLDPPVDFLQEWEAFWDFGDGYRSWTREPIMGEMNADGTLEFSFRFPLSAQSLRIDPFSQDLTMLEPRLHLSSGDAATTLDLGKLELQLHSMVRDGSRLEVRAGAIDPHFSLALPESGERRDLRVTVRGGIAAEPPPLAGRGTWEAFWDEGDGFSGSRRQGVPMVFSGDRLELSFSVPRGSRSLRLDPPAGSRFGFVLPELLLDGMHTADLWEVPLQLNQMTRQGHLLVVSGAEQDPYFAWSMAELPEGPQWNARFTARVIYTPPSWIEDVLALPAWTAAEEALASDPETQSRLDRLRQQLRGSHR